MLSLLLVITMLQLLKALNRFTVNKFSVKGFYSKYDQIRSINADLITFTEEILDAKLHFMCVEC